MPQWQFKASGSSLPNRLISCRLTIWCYWWKIWVDSKKVLAQEFLFCLPCETLTCLVSDFYEMLGRDRHILQMQTFPSFRTCELGQTIFPYKKTGFSGFLDPPKRSEDPDHRVDPLHEGQQVLSHPRPSFKRLDPEAGPGPGGGLRRLRVSSFLSRRWGEEAEDVLLGDGPW